MSKMSYGHHEITLSKPEQIWDPVRQCMVAMIVEYRADGCVTWRKA